MSSVIRGLYSSICPIAGTNRCHALRQTEIRLVNLDDCPPRRVSNVQDIDRVLAHTIENPERITHDGDDTNSGSLRNFWRRFGSAAYAGDDILQPSSDGSRDRRACASRVIGRNLSEISERSSRIDELHAWRNFANTVLISSSVAISPASIEAIAASMVRSSS